MAGTFGIVLLGCGKIANTHAKRLRSHPGVELFFASRNGDKAKEYARRFNGAGAFGSYHDGICDPRVHAVLILTPPDSHLELTLAALNAGKHVIVEKPPFMQAADFDIVRTVKDAVGKQVFVAENYFYKPLAVALRDVLASGAIGELRVIQVNALKTQAVSDWRGDPALGGRGAFFEGGIHWVNLMSNLGPKVVGLQALRPGKREAAERTMVAAFQYACGAVGTLYYSWETNVALRGLHLSAAYGSEGAVTFESNGLFLVVRGRTKRLIGPSIDISGYTAMWRDFVPALRDNREAAFGFEAARRDLILVEAAYRSADCDFNVPGLLL